MNSGTRCRQIAKLWALVVFAVSLIISQSINAQQGGESGPGQHPTGAGDSNAGGATDISEIVVTAERRSESLSKVPISMAAFSQSEMDDLHVRTLEDIATLTPGLYIPPVESDTQSVTDVVMRGINSGGNAATTGIYIDETPVVIRQNFAIGFDGSPHPEVFDLDHVEVLRGPQGTLFGSGAMGGAVRYITPQPNLTETSGYVKAEVSDTERGAPSYAVGMAFGAPVVEGTAAFRLSGYFHSEGGFIDIEDPYTGTILQRNANSSRGYVLRPAFAVTPAEGLSITPAAFIQHNQSESPNSYWTSLLPQEESGAHFTGFGSRVRQPLDDDLDIYSVAIKYDATAVTIQSDTSYTYRNFHDNDDWSDQWGAYYYPFGATPLVPGLSSYALSEEDIGWTRAWQQEFRVSSADSAARITWVGGVYFRHDIEGLSQLISPSITPLTLAAYGLTSEQAFGIPDYFLNGQDLSSYTLATSIAEQKAVFGEITIKVLPKLRANLGVRIERATLEQQQQSFAGPIDGTTLTTSVLPDQKETPITPRFGLTYQYTDAGMVYVTAAKGYRAGGSNSLLANTDPGCASSLEAFGLKAAPATFNSDSLWSYELGIKDSLFEGKVAFQASAYYIDWSGIQTTLTLPSCGQLFTTNFGKAISQGFDFQYAAILIKGLKLGGTVGYDHAYYPNAQAGPPPTNANGTPAGPAPLLNAAGDKLPVPPWTATVSAEYSWNLGNLWPGARPYVLVDYRWTDDTPIGPSADPRVANFDSELAPYPNQGYGLLNFRFGVVHRGLDFSAFVDNATRADPRLGYSHWTYGDPLFSATALRPLTAGLTAFYRF